MEKIKPYVRDMTFNIQFTNSIDLRWLYKKLSVNNEILKVTLNSDYLDIVIRKFNQCHRICLWTSNAKINADNQEQAIDIIYDILKYVVNVSVKTLEEIFVIWDYTLRDVDFRTVVKRCKNSKDFTVENETSEIFETYCMINEKKCIFTINKGLFVIQRSHNSVIAHEGFNKLISEITK